MAETTTRIVRIREPREKPLNLEPLVFPAIVLGGLVFAGVYKDQISEVIKNLIDVIPHAKEILGSIEVPIHPLPPVKIPVPGPGPSPTPTTGSVIFDSNRHWVGKAGQTVTKFGNTGPNGKGFYTAASGNPRLKFVTPTEYELQGSGSGIHPRIYGAVNNYNARLEFDFKFQSGSVDNISFKIRNRHQMGGSCENRVGGFGGHISKSVAGLKIEKCHNIHESGVEKRLPQGLASGRYYRAALTVQDTSGGILQKLDLDYGQGFREVVRDLYRGSFAPYRNKSLFDRQSEFWIRYNGGSGSVRFKNVRMMALGSSANLAYAYSSVPLEERITIA